MIINLFTNIEFLNVFVPTVFITIIALFIMAYLDKY